MNFTKIVHLIGGEKILITDQMSKELQSAIKRNTQGFVSLDGNLINKSSIAYIGNHTSTADMSKMDRANFENGMKIEGKEETLKQIKEAEKKIAIENANKERIITGEKYIQVLGKIVPLDNKPMTSEESARGDAEYYIDKETGEKMYS